MEWGKFINHVEYSTTKKNVLGIFLHFSRILNRYYQHKKLGVLDRTKSRRLFDLPWCRDMFQHWVILHLYTGARRPAVQEYFTKHNKRWWIAPNISGGLTIDWGGEKVFQSVKNKSYQSSLITQHWTFHVAKSVLSLYFTQNVIDQQARMVPAGAQQKPNNL